LAYAAGYVDGDGCFYIGKQSRKFIMHFIISSTNKEILIWFRNNFGGTISASKKTINRMHHKQVYYFSLKKKMAVPFAEQIISFLVEKYLEAKVFILFSKTTASKEKMILISKMDIYKNFTNLVHQQYKARFESQRSTIEPTQQDFAYLAGFIDAECSFGIQKYKVANKPNFLYKITLRCNNTKTPVFEWLLQRFGGRIQFINRKSKNPLHRDQFCWSLTSKSLANILNEIHPFLKYKKPVCEELMKFVNITLPNGGARHTEEFRKSYTAIIEEREQIVHKIHLLNRKGISHLSG
jgi:hypothetical protein